MVGNIVSINRNQRYRGEQMIEAERVTLRSKIVYEKVQILTLDEQKERGLDGLLGEPQIVFKCKDGMFITTTFHLILVQLNHHRTKLHNDCCRKITRATLSGDNVYSDVCLLRKDAYKDAGIPMIFKEADQFVFACPDGMFVANVYHVVKLEV
jgi:hypothetical protein